MKAPAFWKKDKKPFWAWGLYPLSCLYRYGGQRRLEKGARERVPIPVIVVGNVSVGGTGKTPLVSSLSQSLKAQGYNVHILSKGYGGTKKGPLQVSEESLASEVGDEPLLLARFAPTWVAKDRKEGAWAAVDAGADLLLLDDGFQSGVLAYDAAFLVLDAFEGLGNGEVLPLGPLREPWRRAIKRASGVFLVSRDGEMPKESVLEFLKKEQVDPVYPVHLSSEALCSPEELEQLHIKGCIAFAGLGRPEKFEKAVQEKGIPIHRFIAFPDHYPYSTQDIQKLHEEAQERGCFLVTTAKDYVKVSRSDKEKLVYFDLNVSWQWSEEVLEKITRLL